MHRRGIEAGVGVQRDNRPNRQAQKGACQNFGSHLFVLPTFFSDGSSAM